MANNGNGVVVADDHPKAVLLRVFEAIRTQRDEARAMLEAATKGLETAVADRAVRDQQVVDAVIAALAEAGLLRDAKHKRRVIYDQKGRIVGIEDA
jgi:hypothetical protein